MQIKELLAQDSPTFSCEIFPPKKEEGFPGVLEVADKICDLGVDYISVTYGAGGAGAKKTAEICSHIENEKHTTALAHLTCIGATRGEIRAQLENLRKNGIRNVLALRGDRPAGLELADGDYTYAIELVREIKAFGEFCVGAACYPEGHIECAHKEQDIAFLKEKVDAGCDFLVTQMFFDNNIYYNFLYRVLAQNIRVPVIPGIMPVINARQIKRAVELSGTALPPRFQAICDRFGEDPESMQEAGVAYATEQIIDLLANGAKHIHLYTMNRPETARRVLENLKHILRR